MTRLPTNAPIRTPTIDPVPKLMEFPDDVMAYSIVSPIGAENVWLTTGVASKPLLETHCVPAQPVTIATPATAPQKIWLVELRRLRLSKVAIRMTHPSAIPVVS